MIRKIIFAVFLILLCSNCCLAIVENKKISLEEALDIALENNLDLKSKVKNIDIAKNDIKIANKLQNPSIQTYWNFGKAGHGNPNQLGLFDTVELFKRGARKNLAKVNFELASENIEFQKFNLKMDVQQAYVKLVVAKMILKKYEDQKDFLENLLEISNLNNEKNSESDLDTIEAKIAVNQIITELNKARTNEKTARMEFNRTINTIDSSYDALDFELSDKNDFTGLNTPLSTNNFPSYLEIEKRALENRFDIKIANKQIELAKKNLSTVNRNKIPDIEIGAGYGYQSSKTSDDGSFQSGAYLEANLVNIPILYSYKPDIKNAKLQIEQAEINYISTVNKAKKDIEIAYENFLTAKLNLNCYDDKILKDSNNLFKLFEKTYRKEDVDFATLAAVEESYSDVIKGYSEALSDYYISWIDFLRETNCEKFDFEENTL